MDVLNSVEIDFDVSRKTQNGYLEFGGFEIRYRYIKGASDSIIVAFDGWDPQKDYDQAPTYSKWKYFKSLGGSCLYISHPVFKKMKVSHSVYTAILNAIKSENAVFKLIKFVVAGSNYRNKNIIFYGGSSGGFSAIQYSLLFPRSTCCAVNPETSLTAHEGDLISKNMGLVLKAIGSNSIQELSALNLKTLLVRKNALPHLFIYQNIKDDTYYDRHFIPFTEMFRARATEIQSGRLTISEYCEGNGHSALVPNKVLSAAFGVLMAGMSRSIVAEDCHSRLLYRLMSDLECKVSFYFKFEAAHDPLLTGVKVLFCRYKLEPNEKNSFLKELNLSSLSKATNLDHCIYEWSDKLPAGTKYVYLVSDTYNLNLCLVTVKELMNLSVVKGKAVLE